MKFSPSQKWFHLVGGNVFSWAKRCHILHVHPGQKCFGMGGNFLQWRESFSPYGLQFPVWHKCFHMGEYFSPYLPMHKDVRLGRHVYGDNYYQ